jgi:hypothetical protein
LIELVACLDLVTKLALVIELASQKPIDNRLGFTQAIIIAMLDEMSSITSFFSSVVERGIAAIARHPKVPVSITGGSCSFGNFNACGQLFVIFATGVA